MAAIQTHRARDESELEGLGPIVGWAFGIKGHDALNWLRQAGLEHVRVGYSARRLVSGLVEIPMGQWFGGNSVPMLGIAGVAVAPQARGKGLAFELMRETLREARANGLALSTLYPASHALYRKLGYELAGSYSRFSLHLAACPRKGSPLALSEGHAEDHTAIEKLYRSVARHRPGYLDRGAYVWSRIRKPAGEPARGIVVRGAQAIEGYAYLTQKRNSSVRHDLTLTDWVAATPQAMHSLLAFLGTHATTADRASFWGSSADARLFALPERAYNVEVESYFMLRLVDVPAALLARGYPELDAELDLALHDEILPENSGRYRLRLHHGKPELQRARSGGKVSLDVRALAALYSGFIGPHELARTGLLTADARSLATLSLMFAGPAPALADYF